MNKEERKMFRNNTIKLVIGLILLGLSINYLHKHPAEKVSVRSWFGIMWQRAEVFISQTFTGKWDMLKQQYEYEKYMKELVKMAEGQKCLDVSTIKKLNEKYAEVQEDSVDEFKSKLTDYKRYLDSINTIVTRGCAI